MPGVALHVVVAQRTIEALRASGFSVPFDLDDPSTMNAFLHGSIGPDLGYFPGGYRPLSDLSHCVRTGTLTRTLIRTAQTPNEHAFAWGWLSHVLADREVHPWIGRGVGEALTGRRDRFVCGSSNPHEHLRVEMGVDAAFAARLDGTRPARFDPVFDEESVAYLERAYARTYGVAIPSERFLISHRATGLRATQGLATIPILGALMEERGGSLVVDSVRWLLRRAYDSAPLRGMSLAYLNPIRPDRWLLSAVSRAVQGLPSLFMDVCRAGAASLGDHNLDTGRLSVDEADHPGTARALESLRVLLDSAGKAVDALPPIAAGHARSGHDRQLFLEA